MSILKSLVTIRMNEISQCPVKSLVFCSKIETKINTNLEKGSDEEEIRASFLKCDIYDPF